MRKLIVSLLFLTGLLISCGSRPVEQVEKDDSYSSSQNINARSIAGEFSTTSFEDKLVSKLAKLKNDDAVARLALLIEQISIPSTKISYYLPTVEKAQHILMKELEVRLAKYEVDIKDYDGNMGWNANSRNSFLQKLNYFKNADNKNGYCGLLYLLHALAVSRTTLRAPFDIIEASKLYNNVTVREIPTYQQDLDYVKWQFRYFYYTSILESGYIRYCQDLIFPNKKFSNEIKLRLEFLENGIFIESKKSNEVINQIRYPIGRAVNMCGRPNLAHYFDYAGSQDESRGFPQSISCITGYPPLSELEGCILNL